MKLLTNAMFGRWSLLVLIVLTLAFLSYVSRVHDGVLAVLSLIAGGVLTRQGVAAGTKGSTTARPDDID